jgi:hypothetical protein
VIAEPLLSAAAVTVVTFVASYLAFGGRFPFTRSPLRFVTAALLAFLVGFAVLAVVAGRQR